MESDTLICPSPNTTHSSCWPVSQHQGCHKSLTKFPELSAWWLLTTSFNKNSRFIGFPEGFRMGQTDFPISGIPEISRNVASLQHVLHSTRPAYPQNLLSVLQTACVHIFRFWLIVFFFCGCTTNQSKQQKNVKGQFFTGLTQFIPSNFRGINLSGPSNFQCWGRKTGAPTK